MQITIQFSVDNAAFDDPNEVELVLRTVTERIAHNGYDRNYTFPLRDSNGNTIGACVVGEQ